MVTEIEQIYRVAEKIGPAAGYTGGGREILLAAESRCAGIGGKWGGRDKRTRAGRVDAAAERKRMRASTGQQRSSIGKRAVKAKAKAAQADDRAQDLLDESRESKLFRHEGEGYE